MRLRLVISELFTIYARNNCSCLDRNAYASKSILIVEKALGGVSKTESPVGYINIFIQCHSFITPQPAQHGYFIFSSEAQAPSTFICWRRCCILRTATANNIGKYIANICGETRECVQCLHTNKQTRHISAFDDVRVFILMQ